VRGLLWRVRARRGLAMAAAGAALGVIASVAGLATSAGAVAREGVSPPRRSAGAATLPALVWSTPQSIDKRALIAVKCPTASFCVAIDKAGNILTAKAPLTRARDWRRSHLDSAITALACPSSALCVAVDSNGHVLTSRDPAGGAKTWSKALIDSISPGELSAVACRSDFCVAAGQGNAFVSTNPTGGRRAWKSFLLPSNGDSPGIMSGFSCPLKSLCVGVDQSTGEGFLDDVYTSTDPGRSNKWNLTKEFTNNSFNGVACPTKSLCVAPTAAGRVMATTKPTHGRAWHATTLVPDVSINAVACSSAAFCVLGDSSGTIESSTTPTAAKNAWLFQNVAPKDAIESLACPTSRLCIAVTHKGDAIVGRR
jgi:hypothetical protein